MVVYDDIVLVYGQGHLSQDLEKEFTKTHLSYTPFSFHVSAEILFLDATPRVIITCTTQHVVKQKAFKQLISHQVLKVDEVSIPRHSQSCHSVRDSLITLDHRVVMWSWTITLLFWKMLLINKKQTMSMMKDIKCV